MCKVWGTCCCRLLQGCLEDIKSRWWTRHVCPTKAQVSMASWSHDPDECMGVAGTNGMMAVAQQHALLQVQVERCCQALPVPLARYGRVEAARFSLRWLCLLCGWSDLCLGELRACRVQPKENGVICAAWAIKPCGMVSSACRALTDRMRAQ